MFAEFRTEQPRYCWGEKYSRPREEIWHVKQSKYIR